MSMARLVAQQPQQLLLVFVSACAQRFARDTAHMLQRGRRWLRPGPVGPVTQRSRDGSGTRGSHTTCLVLHLFVERRTHAAHGAHQVPEQRRVVGTARVVVAAQHLASSNR